MFGAYAEMGYFQVDANGSHVNPYAWNRVANMLYLESPAGCDDPIGFSYCTKGGKVSKKCSWDDKTQAEAYAHTLAAFFQEFPEFKENDMYLSHDAQTRLLQTRHISAHCQMPLGQVDHKAWGYRTGT
jgi:carboxypeptidase C (cathepsin A)